MRAAVLVVLGVAACGTTPSMGDDGPSGTGGLPPANAKADYQLGGAYAPPAGVTIVSRDRMESPAPGLYNICYVNGFQIQHTDDDESFWMTSHPDLILQDGASPVIDQDWDEMLIDVSTPEKRGAVAASVGEWIDGCAAAGFDAIEIDNLDSYSRSHDLLSEDDNVSAMGLFSARAHDAGLMIGQKNSSEIVARKAELGTDFAVAEECDHFDECDAYQAGYGDEVIVIEYEKADFDAGCAAFPGLSIILRDRDLVTPDDPAYVFDGC